jgi:predicted kinase
VHLTQGLPASGKTTLALQLVADGAGRVRRVSLDDLRHMLDSTGKATAWDPERERTTVAAQALMVRQLVADGYDVVVDNTHLHPGQVLPLTRALAGTRVDWAVHSLLGVPLTECLERDARRTQRVGADAIHALHRRWREAAESGWTLTAAWLKEAQER